MSTISKNAPVRVENVGAAGRVKAGGARSRLGRGVATVALAVVAACVPPATQRARVSEPAVCADSAYLQLKRQHPYSLSDADRRMLHALDRTCAPASAQHQQQGAMMGQDHGRRHWLAIGAGAVVMVAMMVLMR